VREHHANTIAENKTPMNVINPLAAKTPASLLVLLGPAAEPDLVAVLPLPVAPGLLLLDDDDVAFGGPPNPVWLGETVAKPG
jgi:hypothetical protein